VETARKNKASHEVTGLIEELDRVVSEFEGLVAQTRSAG
jgi:hypothetical protein